MSGASAPVVEKFTFVPRVFSNSKNRLQTRGDCCEHHGTHTRLASIRSAALRHDTRRQEIKLNHRNTQSHRLASFRSRKTQPAIAGRGSHSLSFSGSKFHSPTPTSFGVWIFMHLLIVHMHGNAEFSPPPLTSAIRKLSLLLWFFHSRRTTNQLTRRSCVIKTRSEPSSHCTSLSLACRFIFPQPHYAWCKNKQNGHPSVVYVHPQVGERVSAFSYQERRLLVRSP